MIFEIKLNVLFVQKSDPYPEIVSYLSRVLGSTWGTREGMITGRYLYRRGGRAVYVAFLYSEGAKPVYFLNSWLKY